MYQATSQLDAKRNLALARNSLQHW